MLSVEAPALNNEAGEVIELSAKPAATDSGMHTVLARCGLQALQRPSPTSMQCLHQHALLVSVAMCVLQNTEQAKSTQVCNQLPVVHIAASFDM